MTLPRGARDVACEVLRRVEEDDAYAAAALGAALERGLPDARDRALATELVYGVLRTEAYLRRRIEEFGRPRGDAGELWRRLLVAAYELDFLDRIPGHATIFEAVEAVKRCEGPRVAGFANAVLRKIAAGGAARMSLEGATLASTPSWLRKRLERALGAPDAHRLLTGERRPEPTLRHRPGRPVPGWFPEQTEPDEVVVGCHRFVGGGDPRRFPEYSRGDFVVQEKGAQILGALLELPPGARVLDACAGRGQKTAQLAERLDGGVLAAVDLHAHKLAALSTEFARLGLAAETRVHDFASEGGPPWEGTFTHALVDAPCTGVGTVARRPEILRRLTPEDPTRLGALQATILRGVARALAPGADVLYATCSPLVEECEEVLAEVAELYEPRPFGERARPFALPEATSFRLLPTAHGTDGYFVARLRRR